VALVDIQGDLFEAPGPAFGHGVNLQGDMGGGVAAIVRKLYPEAHRRYLEACKDKTLGPGEIQPVLSLRPTSKPGGRGVYVINMATQDMPGPDARLEWIERSTRAALEFCRLNGYQHLNIPRLGSGIGSLDWETQVRPALVAVADEYPQNELRVFFL
jgi:O-acetyl-ADP-ribose deacetylase (regulator of RNase III)